MLVMGSANFSHNSTEVNDSNSVIIRGDTAVADIYATEFMRMFEHYHFRAKEEGTLKSAEGEAPARELALEKDDRWSVRFFVEGSPEALDRRMFAGTTL